MDVGVEGVPFGDGGEDAHGDYFVAEGAEVVVALVEFLLLEFGAFDVGLVGAVGVEGCFHGHHDVVVLAVVDVCAYGPAEGLSAHGSGDHFN